MKKSLLTAAIFSGCTSVSDTKGTGPKNVIEETSQINANLTDLMKLDKNALSDYDYTRFKDKNITLNVCNWGEYMAVEQEDYMDVNTEFEKLTGINTKHLLPTKSFIPKSKAAEQIMTLSFRVIT